MCGCLACGACRAAPGWTPFADSFHVLLGMEHMSSKTSNQHLKKHVAKFRGSGGLMSMYQPIGECVSCPMVLS